MYDKKLQIQTTGLREWGSDYYLYNRYEATPYAALEKLIEQYEFHKGDCFVDFGCGRGRVAFFIHYKYNIPVKGIEANSETFVEALQNEQTYRKKRKHIKAPITFQNGLAEQYKVAEEDTVFYFFNPFSIRIFKKVITNIIHSYEEHRRTIELILYYPLPEIKQYIKEKTKFEMMNKIKVPGDHGKYGEFVIYRIKEDDLNIS